MPPRDFLARRRQNRHDREEEMRHTDLPPPFDVEAEVLRERAFELLPDLTMDDVNALADAGIPGISFPEEGLLSDKMEELIRGAIDPSSSSEGGLTDIWPNTPGTPPISPNPGNWLVREEGPFPPRPNGTPPHLLDPSTPSPLLLLFDPVGEISPEQVANDIVAGAAVADQARNVAAQNTGQFRHVDVAALPPEEQARVTQALSGAGQGLSHADQSVGGDPLGAAVPPHSNLYNRALRHQSPEQAQRHVSQANNQRHALGNPGAEFLPRQQVNAPLPSSQTPAPPSTGNPISDRAIQLAQGRFQQPNGFPVSAFDHVGFGQRAIADALARLTGQSHQNSDQRLGFGNRQSAIAHHSHIFDGVPTLQQDQIQRPRLTTRAGLSSQNFSNFDPIDALQVEEPLELLSDQNLSEMQSTDAEIEGDHPPHRKPKKEAGNDPEYPWHPEWHRYDIIIGVTYEDRGNWHTKETNYQYSTDGGKTWHPAPEDGLIVDVPNDNNNPSNYIFRRIYTS